MAPYWRAAVRPWVEPGRAGEVQSGRPNGSVGACMFMPWRSFLRSGTGVGGDAVDRQQGDVEDERLRPHHLHRLDQARGEGGTDVDGLAYAAEDGRDPDIEPGYQWA